ncbi:MAG: efflux RND transporter periplasmic adaptor subunit, partial [Gemmatimonadota bacterium]|nr:efflux RND transporter periplasmic adaptor subunit [Gemmatimonadota bacterium]
DLARARTELARARARVAVFTEDTAGVDQVYALRAPLGGVVVDRSITPGQEVRPDQMLANAPQLVSPLFMISDPSRLWLLLDLPEGDAGRLAAGESVRFQADASPGAPRAARVTWVSNAVDPTTRTVKARAAIDNTAGLLRAEMLVSAQLPATSRRVVTVPANAVIFRDGIHVVFVQEARGRIRRTTVDVGAEHAGRLTIARGVAPGARIVTTGAILLDELFASAGKS